MHLSAFRFRVFASGFAIVLIASCGARTGVRGDGSDAGADAAPGPQACAQNVECFTDLCNPRLCIAGFCEDVGPVECDDGDECTVEGCVLETGECESSPLTFDRDGDGFLGPRPGFEPSAPGACGDDCDDTSPLAFPGGGETCDGVDNDCNGVIDDNARFAANGLDPVQISLDLFQTEGGGVAFNGNYYGVTYSGRDSTAGRARSFFKGIAPDGSTFGMLSEEPIALVNNDTFAGPVEWTGEVFGMAWTDRRDENFEVYFNQFDVDGEKLTPDLRVTTAPRFSVGVSMVFTGAEYLLMWADDRDSRRNFRVYGQRIDVLGEPIGENVALTEEGINATGASFVVGRGSLGLAYKQGDVGSGEVVFRTVSFDLEDVGPVTVVTTNNAVDPVLAFNDDRFVLLWEQKIDGFPGRSVFGATLSETGAVLMGETPIITSAGFARDPTMLTLGNRILVTWAEEQSARFNLFARMFSPDLVPIAPTEQLTDTNGDSTDPVTAFGPDGDVGVFFMDRAETRRQRFFVRLVCVAGT